VSLITGCSSGFGREIARGAIKEGYAVTVTARNISSLEEFQALEDELVQVTELDVVTSESVAVAAEKTIARFGRINVLANNAGYGYYQIFEEPAKKQSDKTQTRVDNQDAKIALYKKRIKRHQAKAAA